MKVLVACEMSGRVRDAFIAKGCDAWSCDLLPSIVPSDRHIQGDVKSILAYDWDLVIAHPPCTALCVSGNRHYSGTEARLAALEFFKIFVDCAPKVCIENPVGVVSTLWKKPTQYIQPWMFGEPESKKTGLWLRSLPPLIPTKILSKPACGYWENQTPSGQNKIGPSSTRSQIRSLTYYGIAKAMAEQWS